MTMCSEYSSVSGLGFIMAQWQHQHLGAFCLRATAQPRESGWSATDRGDFPGGPVTENLPANAEDMGWILGPGGSHMLPRAT